jgi:hypothetical protein
MRRNERDIGRFGRHTWPCAEKRGQEQRIRVSTCGVVRRNEAWVLGRGGQICQPSVSLDLGSLRPVPLSTRALMIITVILLIAVAVAAVIVWWITRQPPLIPIEIPTVSVA